MTSKKVPMRMCVGCRAMHPKAELIRAVKTAEGEVVLDATGKKNGRGAYICRNAECFEKARKARALDRAFEMKISEEVYDSLKEELNAIER